MGHNSVVHIRGRIRRSVKSFGKRSYHKVWLGLLFIITTCFGPFDDPQPELIDHDHLSCFQIIWTFCETVDNLFVAHGFGFAEIIVIGLVERSSIMKRPFVM
jgi:hypothetical protein